MNSYARLHLQDSYTADISCLCISVHTCSVYSRKAQKKNVSCCLSLQFTVLAIFLLEQSGLGNISVRERESQCVQTSGSRLAVVWV